jgi:hypothetical protein
LPFDKVLSKKEQTGIGAQKLSETEKENLRILISEFYYHHYSSFMPKVMIFKSGSGYKMQVDGVDRADGVTMRR